MICSYGLVNSHTLKMKSIAVYQLEIAKAFPGREKACLRLSHKAFQRFRFRGYTFHLPAAREVISKFSSGIMEGISRGFALIYPPPTASGLTIHITFG
jgi:hypothetical protein